MSVKKSASESSVWDQIKTRKLLDALLALGQTSSLDLPEALQIILEQLETVLGYESAAIFLVKEECAKVVAARGFPDVQKALKISFALAEDVLFQEMNRTKRPLVIPDVRKDKRFRALGDIEYIRSWLGAPLVAEGKVIGFLTLNSRNVGHFNQVDAEFVSVFASHAALAIEGARFHEHQRRWAEELEALRQTDLDITAQLDRERLLQTIVQRAVGLLHANSGGIYEYDSDQGELMVVADWGGKRSIVGSKLKVGEGMAGRVVQMGEPIIVDDYTTWPGRAPIYEPDLFRALVEVPLQWEDRILGVLYVTDDAKDRVFTQRDAYLLSLLASQAAIAMENARLMEETHRRAQALEMLHQTSLDITSYQRVPELVLSILERAVELLQAKGGGLYLLDESGEQVKLAAVSNLPDELAGMTLGVGDSVVGQVIKARASLSVHDYRNWPHLLRQYDEYGFTGVAGAPIVWQDKIWGVIAVHHDVEGRTFDQEDLDLLSHLGNMAAVALENARRTDELERLMASAIDAVIAVDEAGRVVRFNERAEQVLGYRKEEVLGQHLGPLYCEPEEARRVKRLLLESKDGRITDHDTFVRTKDGERIPIRLSASLLFDYEGRRAGSAGFFRDLREIESAKRQIRQLDGLLAAGQTITSQLDLPSVLDSIVTNAMKALGDVDAIVLYSCDPDRAEFQVPPVTKGVMQPELIQGPFRLNSVSARVMEIGVAHFADDAAADPVMAGDFVTREDIASSAGVPLKVGEKTVGVMFFNYREFHPFSNEEKNVISILATQAAIAIENAQLYEETHRRLEELEKTKEMLAARTAVAWMGMVGSTWAHKVAGQAAVVRTNVEILRQLIDMTKVDERVFEKLDQIAADVAKLQEIPITAPLSSEEGVESIGVNSLVSERVKMLCRPYRDTIVLNLRLGLEDRATVRASRLWLLRALDILVENAIEAMTESELKVLTILTGAVDGMVEIHVTDTGKGISPEIAGILFKQPVPRGKGQKGSGMGLLLVSSIVQGYGGDIGVASTSPDGTTMVISLPIEEETHVARRADMQSGGLDVLLISSDQQWSELLQEALAPIGEVTTISDGDDAIDSIRQSAGKHQGYAIIVVDASIANDKLGLVRTILEQQSDAKIVIASAVPEWRVARDSFIDAGAIDYIIKSFNRDELLNKFRDILAKAPRPLKLQRNEHAEGETSVLKE